MRYINSLLAIFDFISRAASSHDNKSLRLSFYTDGINCVITSTWLYYWHNKALVGTYWTIKSLTMLDNIANLILNVEAKGERVVWGMRLHGTLKLIWLFHVIYLSTVNLPPTILLLITGNTRSCAAQSTGRNKHMRGLIRLTDNETLDIVHDIY